jgi:DnaK suppressor protein
MTNLTSNDRVAAQRRQRLDALLRRVGKIEGDLRSAHDRDWTEEAAERENDEVLEGLDEMGIAEVQQIRAALRRIEDGSYGICATCRQPIAAARLSVSPSVTTCVACAE